eukprot:192729-Prorocentrum_minimum.AAC.2
MLRGGIHLALGHHPVRLEPPHPLDQSGGGAEVWAQREALQPTGGAGPQTPPGPPHQRRTAGRHAPAGVRRRQAGLRGLRGVECTLKGGAGAN